MFNILDRYISKIIFYNVIITLLMLISLSSIIKFIDQLRKIGQGTYTTVKAEFFTLLSIPKDIEIFLPMSVLIGTLIGLGQLSTYNELIIMQASGFTRMQISKSVVKTAIPFILIIMIISEWIVPYSDKIAHNFRLQQLYNNSLLSIKNKLWIKDKNDFIYIDHINTKNEIFGINIYHFNHLGNLETIRYANTANFKNKIWILSKVNNFHLINKKKIINKKKLLDEWKTNLTPEEIILTTLNPNSISIKKIYHYIQYLKHNNQNTKYYQLNLWKKIFSPFSIIVMMLMALSCVFGPLQSISINIRILIGIILGLLCYSLNKIFGQLGLIYNLPPLLNVILPNIIFFVFSIYMLLKKT
ncbi:Lipopolysaccharide export system permease protein LptG [Serratia symbiotica]|nr:Lipopolysaccharide export system permease protein LptG [Serratia symbiotica]